MAIIDDNRRKAQEVLGQLEKRLSWSDVFHFTTAQLAELEWVKDIIKNPPVTEVTDADYLAHNIDYNAVDGANFTGVLITGTNDFTADRGFQKTYLAPTVDNEFAPKKYVDDATGGGTDPSPPPSLNWSATETRDIVQNTWYPMFRFDHVNTNGKTGMCIFDMGWNDPAGNQAQSVRYRAQATFSGGTVSVSYQLVNHWRVGAQIATNFRSSWNGGRIQLFYRSTNGAHTGTRVTITVVSLDAGTVTNRLGTGDTVSATDYGGTTLPTAN